jgi:hypothetical protein
MPENQYMVLGISMLARVPDPNYCEGQSCSYIMGQQEAQQEIGGSQVLLRCSYSALTGLDYYSGHRRTRQQQAGAIQKQGSMVPYQASNWNSKGWLCVKGSRVG